jgi:hypothetical protein
MAARRCGRETFLMLLCVGFGATVHGDTCGQVPSSSPDKSKKSRIAIGLAESLEDTPAPVGPCNR